MNAIIIIPARLESIRLPRKLLLRHQGKFLLHYTWETAKKVSKAEAVYIATDSQEIEIAAKSFGADIIRTSRTHLSGTSRVAEAFKKLSSLPNLVVNLQGDEPEIDTYTVDKLIEFGDQRGYPVSTMATDLKDSDQNNPNIVKVVHSNERALYFSRNSLPGAERHVGIYVYQKEFLQEYPRFSPGRLAGLEKLEQLQLLELGMSIGVIHTDYTGISIDTTEDFDVFCSRPRGT